MTDLPTIIAELEEAERAATPGPWIPGHHTNPDHPCECRSILCEWYMGAICTVHHSETRAIEEGDNPPPEEAIANARLIALMRTHLTTLIEALDAANARAEATEARVAYLQIIIDCVVANCEASASSYQERIETIHCVTSALALEWAEDSTLKGAPDER